MVSVARARQLALALPEALEQDHHGRPSFRVAGKIFATLWDETHMNVMLDEPGILTATQAYPAVCTELWWGKRLAAVQINLESVEVDLLAELLADAWERRAPKRLNHEEEKRGDHPRGSRDGGVGGAKGSLML
jgi:hypothetical protein